jgi:hypothetical protein
MYDLKQLQYLIDKNDIKSLKSYMQEHNLIVKNNKIVPSDKKEYEDNKDFWHQRQQARKNFAA